MGLGSGIDSRRPTGQNGADEDDGAISPDGLHALLTDAASVIVLDVRSFLCFNQQHVNGAININVPTALLKRRGLSASLFERAICHPADRDRFMDRALKTVVIYDDTTPSGAESTVNLLFKYLSEERVAARVKFLVGGFQAMRAAHPCDCRLLCSTLAALFRCHSDVRLAPKTLHTDTVRCLEPIMIAPNLYLGDEATASNHEALVRNRITHVLNAAKECENCFERSPAFQYKRLNLVDNPNQTALLQILEEAFEFLAAALDKGQGVLVHCKAGQSRSVTVVIAYLMRTNGWTLAHAYSFVQARKQDISPNLGFMGQLIAYEARLRGTASQTPSTEMMPVASPFSRSVDMSPLSYSVS